MKKLKETGMQIHASINKPVDEETFDSFDVNDLNLTALFFQTGYLTVKQVDPLENKYVLNFPNKEVRESFLNFAVKHNAGSTPDEMDSVVESLLRSLENRDLDAFLSAFQTLFASIAARQLEHVKAYEGFYHSLVFIVLKLLGVNIDCEVQSNFGATDALVKTKDTIYLFEFKNRASGGASAALEQIKSRGYHTPHLADQREVILAGIAFDPKHRNLTEIRHETAEK